MFDLPIVRTVQPPDGCDGEGVHRATARRSTPRRRGLAWTGWTSPTPRRAIIEWLEATGHGARRGHLPAARLAVQPAALLGRAVPDRLRRDRAAGRAARVDAAGRAARDRRLLARSRSRPEDADSTPEPPLAPADRLGRGRAGSRRRAEDATGARRTRCRSGRARAGTSCATWTRPTPNALVDPEVERYWMGPNADRPLGGVDLYVGGVEHAVLHLLYARFWHKVLFDLGYVSSSEPFHRLFNQGMIAGLRVSPTTDGRLRRRPTRSRSATAATSSSGEEVQREYGKMGKSLKNVGRRPTRCTPTTAPTRCGCTRCSWARWTQSRPWDTKAVVGAVPVPAAGLARRSSTRAPATPHVSDDAGAGRAEPRCCTARSTRSATDYETLRFNTSIARLTELNNAITQAYPDGGDAARGGRAAGADAGAARPAHRRGAVVAAGARRRRWRASRSRSPTTRCWSTRPSRSRCRSTARCARVITVPADADAAAMEAAARGRRAGRRRARRAGDAGA